MSAWNSPAHFLSGNIIRHRTVASQKLPNTKTMRNVAPIPMRLSNMQLRPYSIISISSLWMIPSWLSFFTIRSSSSKLTQFFQCIRCFSLIAKIHTCGIGFHFRCLSGCLRNQLFRFRQQFSFHCSPSFPFILFNFIIPQYFPCAGCCKKWAMFL